MSSLFIILLTTALGLSLPAARPLDEKESEALTTEIKELVAALQEGDFRPLLKKTHPALVQLVGGQKKYSELLAKTAKTMEDADFSFESYEVGKSGKLHLAGKEEIYFIPTTAVMNIGEKKIKSESYMVAVRAVGGNEWSFLDGAGFKDDPSLFQKLFPKAPEGMPLPETRMTILN